MLDFQHHQTIAGFFVWDMPFLRGNDSALGKILGGWSLTANGYWNFDQTGLQRRRQLRREREQLGRRFRQGRRRHLVPEDGDHGPGRPALPVDRPGGLRVPERHPGPDVQPRDDDDGVNVIDQLPWAWRLNAGLIKDFRIVGDTKLQFRLEAFNLFNHANLNDPNTSVDSSDFGKIRGKYGDGRRIQMGIRFIF